MEQDYKPGMLPNPEQDERKLFFKFHYKGILIILIPLLFAPILICQTPAYRFIYLVFVVYTYYICNVIPVGAIAFMYIVFMPLLGIMDSKQISRSYYTDDVFITYGCIFMGLMMDASNLSERFAVMIISGCGTNIRILQLIFMMLTTFTSIFFSSTFMCAFWMKIAQALLKEFGNYGVLKLVTDEEPYERQSPPYPSKPVIGMYLTIAYSGTLGAMASPFQNPNNMIVHTLKSTITVKPSGLFVLFVAPMIGGLLILAIWINVIFLGLLPGTVRAELRDLTAAKDNMIEAMEDKKYEMGNWPVHSILGLVLIILTMILLLLRDLQMGRSWHGWSSNIKSVENLSSVPIILIFLLYIAIPANYMFCRYYCCKRPNPEGTTPSLVGWKILHSNTPWAHVLMLAAANCTMAAYKHSKLLDAIHGSIPHRGFSKSKCLLIGSLISTFFNILSPSSSVIRYTLIAVAETEKKMAIHMGGLSVPYVTAIHNNFMLPVSCPGNTIISGWGNIRPFHFILGGLVPTFFIMIFITRCTDLLGGKVFIGY